jgi:hypothetical protein
VTANRNITIHCFNNEQTEVESLVRLLKTLRKVKMNLKMNKVVSVYMGDCSWQKRKQQRQWLHQSAVLFIAILLQINCNERRAGGQLF